MKRLSIITAFLFLLGIGAPLNAQGYHYSEKLGLPGDNLNLYAVLQAFQESPTLEEFEQRINDPKEMINNLDLNGDRRVDYIQVRDYPEGDNHYIVLRVALNSTEIQDVAVINVLRTGNNSVTLQVIGDPALYGDDYIVEPNYYDDNNINATANPGYTKAQNVRGFNVNISYTSGNQVYMWPIFRYLFNPSYIAWVSPWSWNYYPMHWKPWRQRFFDYYYGYHFNHMPKYFSVYHKYSQRRDKQWEKRYQPHKAQSNIVIIKRDNGDYRRTYTRPEMRSTGINRFNRDHKAVQNETPKKNNGWFVKKQQPKAEAEHQKVERKSSEKPMRDQNRRGRD